MSLVSAVVTLIIVGILLWLINTFIPMDGKIKTILNVLVVIAVILGLLYGFGVLDRSGNVSLPSVR
jgi:predicted membrane protein